ncbi:AraC family transcriptional regulator [Capsulimonas corticalis]|uniref:AraC family transcriptional regulator n=1 Tax=Capsulimonas corticalis TaxID=2219043 RepID=A0A402CTC7_9BACT|nr:AraC family transcriptional regulator [Capsulimonas corticalis]BDI30773.1 AraC family transcriptional regulator [Capsulimonas corticalis]
MKYNDYGVPGFQAALISVTAGVFERPEMEFHSIGVNMGAPARVRATRDGRTDVSVHETLAVDIAPAGMPSWVEVEWAGAECGEVMFLRVTPGFLGRVAAQSEWSLGQPEIKNQFHFRDPQIERLALLFQADLTAGQPGGRLYGESLATAFGVQLLRRYTGNVRNLRDTSGGLGARRMRLAVEYIQSHLSEDMTLTELAAAVGLGASQFRLLFKQSLGVAPHQYVIARRVDRAKELLERGGMTAGEAASEVGFADQSHLTRHMRRLLGVTPGVLARRTRIGETF